jgi:hypothetical protein
MYIGRVFVTRGSQTWEIGEISGENGHGAD